MALRLWGTISGCGRSSGAVIPALGSGRYSPGPNIVLPSWLKGSDPNFTITVFWGQPGTLATVSENPMLSEPISDGFPLLSLFVMCETVGLWRSRPIIMTKHNARHALDT